MKNKNVLIAAVVVLILLLLGAGAYLMLNKNSAGTQKENAEKSQTNTNQTPSQAEKSLLDLLKMGQNLRCTFKTEVASGSNEGTVYVSGENVRGDFTVTTSDGKKTQTSMIKKGDTSYIWGSDFPTGIKMTLSFDKMSENAQSSKYVDANQKLNYSCAPWNVDNSLFTVPTNIKFTDMTSLVMPKTTGTETKTMPGSSDPCAQLTGDVKTACENALKQTGN